MKRGAIVFGLSVCVFALFAHSSAQAADSRLYGSPIKFEHSLRTLANVPPEQRAWLALSMAIPENGTTDQTTQAATRRIARVDTTEYVRSDTSYDWSGSAWVGSSRTTYTYNGSNLQTNEVLDTFDGATWTHASQTTSTYNGSAKLATATLQEWVSGAWTNQSLATYSYDGSGNIFQVVYQAWSGSAFVNSNRFTVTYTGGFPTSTLTEKWVSNAWTNLALHTNTFDGSGRVTVALDQSWQSNAWANQSQTTNTYNGGGDKTGSVVQIWQSNAWTNVSKQTYVYNGSHQELLDTTASWFVTMWLATTVDSTKYSGSLVSERVHASLFGAGATRNDYTYDSQGYLTIEVDLEYNLGTQEWDNVAREVHVYTGGGTVSCCVGKRGNVNGLGITDITDLSSLVSYLAGGGYVLPCPEAANVNGSGIVDITDLSSLISYLAGGGYVLPNCP